MLAELIAQGRKQPGFAARPFERRATNWCVVPKRPSCGTPSSCATAALFNLPLLTLTASLLLLRPAGRFQALAQQIQLNGKGNLSSAANLAYPLGS